MYFIESPTDVRHPLKGEVRRFVVIFMYIPIHTYLRSARAPPRLFDWGTDSKAPSGPKQRISISSANAAILYQLRVFRTFQSALFHRGWGGGGMGVEECTKIFRGIAAVSLPCVLGPMCPFSPLLERLEQYLIYRRVKSNDTQKTG